MRNRYHYDARSDSLYIHIKDGQEDSFEEIVPGINVEFDAGKELIGIEILNASRFSSRQRERSVASDS